jgi:hypothetical protein
VVITSSQRQWSPKIVRAMNEDEEFKEQVMEMIDGVVKVIGKKVFKFNVE